MILLINVFSPSRLDLLWNKALSASVLSHTFYSLELFNPLMGTLKPQSNGPLCSHTVIGTLAVDGWAHGWYIEEGPGRAAAPPSPLLAVPNVTDHPSTASVPTSYYSMRLNNHVWAYCPHGRQRRCQEDPVSSPLQRTGEDNQVVPASRVSGPSNRIWNNTTLRSPKDDVDV